MHTDDNPGERDRRRYRQKARLILRIKTAHRDCYSEGSHRMTGGERKPVRRRNHRPTMRFNLAGAPPSAERFYPLKDQDRNERRKHSGKEGAVTIVSPANEHKGEGRGPEQPCP